MSKIFNDNGFFIFDDWSTVNVTGDDAIKFINGFCTNDIQKLEIGESCEAFFTDVKARILAYAYAYKHSETSLTLIVTSSRAEELLNHLDRYLIREAVELSLGNHVLIFTGSEPSQFSSPKIALGVGQMIHLLESSERESAVETLTSEGFESFEPLVFKFARIWSGLILLDGIDVDSDNLPQEVDRIEQTISFTKGCYLGQEPVARIDALGQVNWLLRKISAPKGTLKTGEDISKDGKVVAKVKSLLNLEHYAGDDLALAYVRRQLANDGTEIPWNGNTVTVNEFPFK